MIENKGDMIMKDIVKRLEEAAGDAVLRNIKWDFLLERFFSMYNSVYFMHDRKNNGLIQNAIKDGKEMMESLQDFIDDMPDFEVKVKEAIESTRNNDSDVAEPVRSY